jgi:hypothetical protein
MNPSVRQPTAKTANCFLIFCLPFELCPSIEPDLPAERNTERIQPHQTDEIRTRFQPFLFEILRNSKKGWQRKSKTLLKG